MEAGEPEERAAEENEVVEKDWERKAERMGSEAMESSADVAVAMLVVLVEKVGLVKVERRWRGEGVDLWSGDAGEAIFFFNFWYRKGNAFPFFLALFEHYICTKQFTRSYFVLAIRSRFHFFFIFHFFFK